MNSLISSIILISSLILSGCYSSPTDKNGEGQNELHLLWEYAYDLDGGAPRVKPLIFGNMVITSGDIKVTALDYTTGELIWKTPFEHHRQLMNRSFGVGNNLIVGSVLNRIMTWDITNGEQQLNFTFPDTLSFNDFKGITTIEETIIAVSNGNNLYNLDYNGDLKIISIDGRSYETTVYNDVLFAGQRKDNKGIVSAYTLDTMDMLWRFEPSNFGFFSREAPIIENDRVYIGTTTGSSGTKNGFFALNAQTGQEIWRQEDIFTYSAVLVDEYIYVNDAAGIYKLRKSNGEIEWYRSFQAGAGTAPIAYGYGYLYAPHSGTMHIVDAETGEIVHRFSPPKGSYFWLVTVEKGRVFAQSNRHLYAFAPWGHTEALE